jgi:hypothetical protein
MRSVETRRKSSSATSPPAVRSWDLADRVTFTEVNAQRTRRPIGARCEDPQTSWLRGSPRSIDFQGGGENGASLFTHSNPDQGGPLRGGCHSERLTQRQTDRQQNRCSSRPRSGSRYSRSRRPQSDSWPPCWSCGARAAFARTCLMVGYARRRSRHASRNTNARCRVPRSTSRAHGLSKRPGERMVRAVLAVVTGQIEVGKSGGVGDAEFASCSFGEPAGLHA